ncbi:MAG: 4Fe-4S dicluster domain-containing protein [Pelovirga sp.]
MARYGMVIDLHKCTSCGACGLGCKTENNTDDRADGQTHNWADYHHSATGTFPNVSYETLPVLCNHCTNAPCVTACPVTPKAMHKNAKGMTMHNEERCIGCRACQNACPYSSMDVAGDEAQYSVISFNDFGKVVHAAYEDNTEAIKDCTTSGAEVAKKAGMVPPYATKYAHPDYNSVRGDGVVEKCILCDHRIENGKQPYCNAVCPSRARVAGDLDNPNSDVAKLVKKYGGRRLKNNKGEFLAAGEKGVEPNVYYVRAYSARK